MSSIYQRFCTEIKDENGGLKKLTLNYPDNFNFGYDVVDEYAAVSPDKRAMVWCNVENEDRKSTRLNSSHTDSSRMPSSA